MWCVSAVWDRWRSVGFGAGAVKAAVVAVFNGALRTQFGFSGWLHGWRGCHAYSPYISVVRNVSSPRLVFFEVAFPGAANALFWSRYGPSQGEHDRLSEWSTAPDAALAMARCVMDMIFLSDLRLPVRLRTGSNTRVNFVQR